MKSILQVTPPLLDILTIDVLLNNEASWNYSPNIDGRSKKVFNSSGVEMNPNRREDGS